MAKQEFSKMVCLNKPDEVVCKQYAVLVNQPTGMYNYICMTCSDLIQDYVEWEHHTKREADLIKQLHPRLAQLGDHLIRRDSEEEQVYIRALADSDSDYLYDEHQAMIEEDDAMLAEGHSDNYGDR